MVRLDSGGPSFNKARQEQATKAMSSDMGVKELGTREQNLSKGGKENRLADYLSRITILLVEWSLNSSVVNQIFHL